jgi:hypothetical protein
MHGMIMHGVGMHNVDVHGLERFWACVALRLQSLNVS